MKLEVFGSLLESVTVTIHQLSALKTDVSHSSLEESSLYKLHCLPVVLINQSLAVFVNVLAYLLLQCCLMFICYTLCNCGRRLAQNALGFINNIDLSVGMRCLRVL